MDEEVYNPLHRLIEDTFKKTTKDDLQKHYLQTTKGIKKWTCYSDYCFDDDGKPNDVFTITLIPYVDKFDLLSEHIKSVAAADIKSSRKVSEKFIEFLREYPLINFSFIINDKKKLLGKNHTDAKKFLKDTFTYMKQQYVQWGKGQPEQKDFYDMVIKKINCVLHLIENDKKIKQIVNMLLVTFFGAYVSSWVTKDNEIEIFGWFSDRDALNEICKNFSIELFQYYMNGLLIGHPFQFTAAPAGSANNAFYEELVRIPDYVTGALADYNMSENLISKDKFNTMLTNYMADNTHNNFVYRLFTKNENLSCARVRLHKKEL